jgi:pilus assembly protein Flp/PilA
MFEILKAWFVTRIARDEQGQDAAEYALLIGLIALVIVGAVIVLGGNLQTVFTAIADAVADWGIGGGAPPGG